MDDDKIQYLTRWLPENLSPNVKVVLSMINDTECHRLLRSYKSGPREITCGQLDYHSRKVLNTSNFNKVELRGWHQCNIACNIVHIIACNIKHML